jgi:hypothetical protein
LVKAHILVIRELVKAHILVIKALVKAHIRAIKELVKAHILVIREWVKVDIQAIKALVKAPILVIKEWVKVDIQAIKALVKVPIQRRLETMAWVDNIHRHMAVVKASDREHFLIRDRISSQISVKVHILAIQYHIRRAPVIKVVVDMDVDTNIIIMKGEENMDMAMVKDVEVVVVDTKNL